MVFMNTCASSTRLATDDATCAARDGVASARADRILLLGLALRLITGRGRFSLA